MEQDLLENWKLADTCVLNAECSARLHCAVSFSLIREKAESRPGSSLNSWVIAILLQYYSWKYHSVRWHCWEGSAALLTLI